MAESDHLSRQALEEAENALKDFKKSVTEAGKSIGGNLVRSAAATSTSFADLAQPMKLVGEAAKTASKAVADLASGIPFLGGALKGANAVIAGAIDTAAGAIEQFGPLLDKQLSTFREVSAVGGFATNSLKSFAAEADKAGLLMDEYRGLIVENSKSLVMLGGSVTGGSAALSKSIDLMKKSSDGAYDSLLNLGYNQKEIAEFTVKQGEWAARNHVKEQRTTQGLAMATQEYMIELDQISRVTGMNRKDLMKARDERQKEVRWKAAMNQIEDADRRQALENLVGAFEGSPVQEGLKEYIMGGGNVIGQASGALELQFEGIGNVLQKFLSGSSNNIDEVLSGFQDVAKRAKESGKGVEQVAALMAGANENLATSLIAARDHIAGMESLTEAGLRQARADSERQRLERSKEVSGLLEAETAQRNFTNNLMEMAQEVLPAVTTGFKWMAQGLELVTDKLLDFVKDSETKLKNQELLEARQKVEEYKEEKIAELRAKLATEEENADNAYKEAGKWRWWMRKKNADEIALQKEIDRVSKLGQADFKYTPGQRMSPDEIAKVRNDALLAAVKEATAPKTDAQAKEPKTALAKTDLPADQAGPPAPKAADGGVLSGPTSGFDAILHGIEAVVPLPDGKTIPVKMNTESLKPLTDMLRQTTTGIAAQGDMKMPSVNVQVTSEALSSVTRAFDQTSFVIEAAKTDTSRAAEDSKRLLTEIKQLLADKNNVPAASLDTAGLENALSKIEQSIKDQGTSSSSLVSLLQKTVQRLEEQNRISKNILNAAQ